MIQQYKIINEIIDRCCLETYLEIGVDYGHTFKAVKATHKECCDISDAHLDKNLQLTYKMSSDDMFAQIPVEKKYDIIFVDALHHEENCDRDIVNSLKHLNKGGYVVVHDICPYQKDKSLRPYRGGEWTGDVYKSITKLSQIDGLEFCSLFEYYCGVCIIKWYDKADALEYPEPSKYEYEDIFNENGRTDMEHLTDLGKQLYHPKTKDEFLPTLTKIER
jgi:hypothetical protein